MLHSLESGLFDAARHKAVVVTLALDTNVHALFATSIFRLLIATLAHVVSPADRVATVIELMVTFDFVRAVRFGLG